MALEPGTLARTRQSDRQHHRALGGACAAGRRRSPCCGFGDYGWGGLLGNHRNRRLRRRRGLRCLGWTASTSTPPAAPTSTTACPIAVASLRPNLDSSGVLCLLRFRGAFLLGFGLAHFCRRRLRYNLCVKVSGLQRSLSGCASSLLWSFFAALHALAHPFAHVWVVTRWRTCEQRVPLPGVPTEPAGTKVCLQRSQLV
jgi:hypothetical protein